jgi:CO dehydrogenase maturation factor
MKIHKGDKMNHISTKILAVAGKGGVGKTSIAATMVRLLTEAFPDKKILAIDADPAVGLSTALGIDVRTTIDDIRKEVIATVEDGNSKAAIELLGDARYRIFDALVETDGFSFIAIGRPEAAGCYCKINSYLKEVIGILAGNFDYVVIDGEAGIEQINRRVMEKVTHLFLITDSSKKGTQVVQTIKGVADELVMYEKIGVIANRLPSENGCVPEEIRHILDTGDIPVLSYIPSDRALAEFDLKGENVFYLPKESAIVQGVAEALKKQEILFI